MLWIISMLLLFCKAYETFHHDDSFYYLRKILGVGLNSVDSIELKQFFLQL